MIMSSSAHSLLFTLDLTSVEGNCKLCVARDVMISLYQQLKFLFLILDSWASHVECVCFRTMFLIFIRLSLKTSWMVQSAIFFVCLSFSLLGSFDCSSVNPILGAHIVFSGNRILQCTLLQKVVHQCVYQCQWTEVMKC